MVGAFASKDYQNLKLAALGTVSMSEWGKQDGDEDQLLVSTAELLARPKGGITRYYKIHMYHLFKQQG